MTIRDAAILRCRALGDCRVVELQGWEAVFAFPRWEARVVAADAHVELAALPNQGALLELGDEAGRAVRVIPLLVTRISYAGALRDGYCYELSLSPSAWPLTLRTGYRIFQQKTTQEIVAEVLRDAGVAASEISWRLVGRYAKRVQCVQYAESEWAFIERLCADDGISYWFDSTADGDPLLVFGDDAGSHDGIAGEVHVPFAEASGMAHARASFFELTREEELVHDAVHVLDYDVRHPDVLIEGRAGEGGLEHFEYPARVPVVGAAQSRAAVRLEQLRRLRVSGRGRSNCVRLQPGRIVRIDAAPDDLFPGDWLVVDVRHDLAESTPQAPETRTYSNDVLLVPVELDGRRRTFRPPVPASRPRIESIETATVTGPPGEEIHVDDLGSIKLALPWDPSGARDDKSSRWARTLQMNMSGSMLLPRVRWEVAVGYIDGNPDEPVVLGQVYNGANPPPYPLPGGKATSSLRSDTSPHDGTSNEIRFGDSAGSQEVWIHASKTQGVNVGGSATTDVGVNETHDVKQGFGVHVMASQTISVGASQDVVVASGHSVQVKGGRVESVGGSETIGVAANRRVAASSYSEVVGALYALQCNAALTTVQGAYTELMGGNLVAAAGLGTHEGVAAARAEIVAGGLNILASSSYADHTTGAKSIAAGAVTEHAAGDVATAAASGAIQVGGGATITASGKLHIQASSISVTAASLTANGGAKLSVGGSAKAEGGTTKLKASTTTRKSGQKEEA